MGDETRKFLKVTVEHGVVTEEDIGSYSYVMLPGKTEAETIAFVQNPDVQVIAQTDAMHAVEDSETGKIYANVFEAEQTIGGVTVKAPCAIIIYKADGYYNIYVSDPTQTQDYITLGFDEAVTLSEGNAAVDGTDFKIHVSEELGKTYFVKFKIN